MRRFLLSVATLFAISAVANAQTFTPGDLAVLRVGDGTTVLGATTINVSILEFTPSGTLVNTFPVTGLTNTGNSTTEGALSLSANGQFLLFGSYNAPVGTTASTATAATVERAIGRMSSTGTVLSVGMGPTAFSASNIRSAVSTDGVNLWASGTSGTGTSAGTGGTWYNNATTPGPVQISNTQNNSRVVGISNNTLMYSTGSATGGAIGIQSLGSPPPTAGPVTPTPVITGVTSQGTSPGQFAFSPGPIAAGSFAYVADGAAGVQRFNFDGTAWQFAYNITNPANSFGLAVNFAGPNPVVYAAGPSGLFSFTDVGAAGAMTSIATPGANFAFRGLAFAPVPEPTTILGFAAGTLFVGNWIRRRRKAKA
jgi:PEP-CTERM motif-containing protein